MKYVLIVLVCCVSACGVPRDKQLHIAAGAAAYGVQKVLVSDKMNKTAAERCALATALGAGKEVRDSFGYGHVEAADFAATVAGCLAADAVVQAAKKPAN